MRILRAEPALGAYGWEQIAALAERSRGHDREGHRAEFVQLVRLAAILSPAPR